MTRRHFKEEETSTAHSTTPTSEAPGELSNGTYETLTAAFALVLPSAYNGKLHSKETPIKTSPNETLANNSQRKKWQEIMSSDQVELLKF